MTDQFADIERRVADASMTLAACIKQNDALHVALGTLRHAGLRMGAACLPDPGVDDALVVRICFAMEGASNKVLRRSTPRRPTAVERAMATGAIVEADYALGGLTPTDLEERLGVDHALIVPIPGTDRPQGVLLLVPAGECDPVVREMASRLARLLADHLVHLAPHVPPPPPPPLLAADGGSFIGALTECAETPGIDSLSEKVLAHCLRFTGSRFGFVGYVDPETGHLLTPTMTRDIFHKCQVAGKTVVFEKPGGLGGVVFDSDRPLIANDPSGHPASVGTPPGHLPIRRFMGIPCLHGGTKRGMIGLANKEGDYNDNDLELVSAFASLYAAMVVRWYAERDLEDERRRFASLYDRAPCGFATTDAEGRILQHNAPLRAMLGWADGEPLPPLPDLVAPGSQGALDMQMAAARDGGAHPVELEYRTTGGGQRVSQTITADLDERGFVRRYFVTVIPVR